MLIEKEFCPDILLFFVIKILQELYGRKGMEILRLANSGCLRVSTGQEYVVLAVILSQPPAISTSGCLCL